ncbi:hypothetical protein H8356DRAFT_581435 [Neocallimastix lanati (nom. inval.)]|nr:hypothetical protein H8356DRAFT_581435 [Neocallimastix sp. JGI-2020a]
MKLSFTSCIALVAAVAKVSADCFSTKLGYPCCSDWNKQVQYTDDDGQWGIENGNWCGMPPQCTGIDQGYSCCNSCKVEYTDNDGDWGIENGNWCGIKSSCKSSQPPSPPQPRTTRTTTTTTVKVEPTSQGGAPINPPKITNGQNGVTTRYWDCCVASCAWDTNTLAQHPVNVCAKDGKTRFTPFDWRVGNVCDPMKQGTGFMCNDNQPWALNENVAYGFVAAGFNYGNQKQWCCTCQRLQFTSGPIAGKQMVVQITNTGGDLGSNHFDIQMPGGGVGYFTKGCSAQWGVGQNGWGERYGGVRSASDCSQLPADLQPGCKWRFDWFKNADNPNVIYERVQCPKELTDITGCIPPDDGSVKKLPW